MRLLAFFAVMAALASATPGDTQGRGRGPHHREQDEVYRARQQGDILPLNVILARVRLRNAEFIGADLDESASVYRLTFMLAGGNVVRLHVDARNGRALGMSR
ncbi:MAG TPA: hypothetical protein VGB08_02530 [Allosphingosinicella sp.]|jgi:hypothetical protein